MNVPVPAPKRWLSGVGALVMALASCALAQTPEAALGEKPAAKAEILPGDYLNVIGQQVKARWRQLYRESPPAFTSERLRVAFMLGDLMAESHLTVQAGDAQGFRNNNQEVQKFCGVLGLADKITSDVNAGSKMAEVEDWPALRKQVMQTQQHIESVLNEQRDEDLAIVMNLGIWIRLFDIGSSLVVGEPALQDKSICIGSVPMLNELVARYERLTEPSRENETISWIGGVLEMLQRHWTAAEGKPTQELVQMTHEKLRFLIGKIEAK